ncbi:MAG TPA: hypothetical protein VKE50_10340 [Thermoanaerobaculia bacterium]|nr:hypothetical protein [Thermoanaerobaculia bacterium]
MRTVATRETRFDAGSSVDSRPAIHSGALKPRLGEYVLVARLGQDALGVVYRAVHSRDGRFARLRILESPELPRGAVLTAIQKREALNRGRSLHPPGRREILSIAEGRPYLAWNETNGWTLDTILAAAREAQAAVPVEGALKIAIGAAAALEHARSAAIGGEPAPHGLLWPGFVTVSRNAEIWVRGFGLAPAVLPALKEPRLERLVAPHLAPEARAGAPSEVSDVYSIGVLLLELLAGRPATLAGPPAYEPDDPFSEDVARLALSAVAPLSQRIASVSSLRERLQRLLEDSPYERSNADLAVFLDDLLSPDGARARRPRTSVWRPLSGPFGNGADEPGASRAVWALRIAAGIAALATLAGVDLAIHHREQPRTPPAFAAMVPPDHAFVREPGPPAGPIAPSAPDTITAAASSNSPTRVTEARREVKRQPRSEEWRAANELAQAWRLRAALSRVSAETFDAWNLASESFREAKVNEQEGERLLARRLYAAAHEAFERAAELYAQAEELSHQERARVIRLSSLEPRAFPSQRF